MEFVNNLPSRELAPGFSAQVVHGASTSVSFVRAKQGHRVPLHHHVHEQVTHIVEGILEMEIGGQQYTLTAGSIFVIPSNTPHNAYAVTDCYIIDFFSPARDDLR
ncbi:MAG: cupin domain-containing protein [Flavihumibacter sp.]|nr:cupin domain-containing protein [Flavihumibacter sp.]